ncbi:hypothetical protein L873DRAFT_1788681 [Choiromyces venosus 120613-1]|uniref:Uncharacterized protein n=1 Tax=Choiromyces venosus 120613-1 TaxID=1336337 RepID=A0A3N4JW79_9PEZI|nr:hypothetical protein L873DRAFT_1788681 [Choiromyces venosus 120613-1]
MTSPFTKEFLKAGVKRKLSGDCVDGKREVKGRVHFESNGDSDDNDDAKDSGDDDIVMQDVSSEGEDLGEDLDMELFGDGLTSLSRSFRELVITPSATKAMLSIAKDNQEYLYPVTVIRTYPNYDPCITLHSVHSNRYRATAVAKRHFKSLYPSLYAPHDPLLQHLGPDGHFMGRECVHEEYFSDGESEGGREKGDNDSDRDSDEEDPDKLPPEIEVTSASRVPLIQPYLHDPWSDPQNLPDEGYVFVLFVETSSSARPGQTSRAIRGVFKYREDANERAENQMSLLVGDLKISDWYDGCYHGEKVYVNCQKTFALLPMREVVVSRAYVKMVRVKGWEVMDGKDGAMKNGYEGEEEEMEVSRLTKEEEMAGVKAIAKYMEEKALLNIKEKEERAQRSREKRRKRREKEKLDDEFFYTLPGSDDSPEDTKSEDSVEEGRV